MWYHDWDCDKTGDSRGIGDQVTHNSQGWASRNLVGALYFELVWLLLRSAIYFHVSPQWGALTLDHITHLLLVPHGAPAKNGHLGHSFLLQPLHRVALRSQQLPHKVELQVYSITMMMIIIDYNNADNDYLLWPQKLNWKYLQCWICIDEKIRFVARAIPDRQSIFVF